MPWEAKCRLSLEGKLRKRVGRILGFYLTGVVTRCSLPTTRGLWGESYAVAAPRRFSDFAVPFITRFPFPSPG